MNEGNVVSKSQWLEARKRLLEEEKALTRQRDILSEKRRALPMVLVEKPYEFQDETGKRSMADLFQGCSQLLVYHFMFGPDWQEGCKSCSFWADNYNGVVEHLQQRDVNLLAVSRAPLQQLQAFKDRMGWEFPWVSSLDSDFNFDFDVSFSGADLEKGKVYYNYRLTQFPASEAPGVSVFYKNQGGEVFHTYSCFSRGLDAFNGAYQLLDLVPKGRNEESLSYPMEWVRLKDQY